MLKSTIKSLQSHGFQVMIAGLVIIAIGILTNFYVVDQHPLWATVKLVKIVSGISTGAGFTIYIIGRILLSAHKKALKKLDAAQPRSGASA